MKRIALSLAVLAPALGMITTGSVAQETTTSQGAMLTEVTFGNAGTYQWNRPSNVRWILIRACGGGGGGAGGISFSRNPSPRDGNGTATGGGGGAGAPVVTTLIGPLAAATYTVVVGRGGAGGSSKYLARVATDSPSSASAEGGTSTSFNGPDISFETQGAPGGMVGHIQTRFSEVQNNYEFFLGGVNASPGMYPGGGSAQAGARGPLGIAGQGNQQGYSGGGGGSLGKGGQGGDVDGSGVDGSACAGGGGAGFLRGREGQSAGGRGGAGSLTIVSVSVVGQ